MAEALVLAAAGSAMADRKAAVAAASFSGVIVLGSGGLNTTAVVYMFGLILALVALILG